MADTGKICNGRGESVNLFQINTMFINCPFFSNEDGNYIFAKLVNNKWQPIYIGQGVLGERIGDWQRQCAGAYVPATGRPRKSGKVDPEC